MVHWVTKAFADLTIDELYGIMRLRSEVFIVEQKCVFLDMDGRDQQAFHCIGFLGNGTIGATSRLFNRDIGYKGYSSIGRVCVSPSCRGEGLGRALMVYSIAECTRLFGAEDMSVKIGAQLYLERFYASLGFARTGDVYLDDGIEHIPMVMIAQSSSKR